MGISWVDKIFLPISKSKEFTFKTYLDDLNDNKYRDNFVFGVLEGESKLLKVNMKNSPNALYVGSMGSGKSKAAVFSLITWMLANSDQTLLFVVDPMKGANDYSSLWEKDSKNRPLYDQVHTILSSEQGVIRLVDLLYDEAMARKEKFNEVQAESFEEFEKKTGRKISRIITVMEEFHAIPYAIMNFYPDFKVDLTTANKFHTLMRIGRSYGIWFVACSQKSTKSDIPSEMAPNFVNRSVFRVQRGEATYLLGDTKAAEIRPDQKGRCITEYGAAQYPIFDNDTEKKLLKRYMKKLKAESFYLTRDIIQDVLSGKSTKDQYKHKKLTDLIKGIESYNGELVITLLHEKQGHRVEHLDSKIDNFGISHIIHWNNDIKVAVMTRCSATGKKITGKHIGRLKKAMEMNECTNGIIYTSMTEFPNSIHKIANELSIEVVDHDDMFKAAYKVELEGEKANLSPDKLADDAKEAGTYQSKKKYKDEFVDDEYSTGSVDDDDEDEFTPHGQFQIPDADSSDEDEVIDLEKIEEDRQKQKNQEQTQKLGNLSKLLGEDDEESEVETPAPSDNVVSIDELDIEQLRREAKGEIEEPDQETKDEVLEELKNESSSFTSVSKTVDASDALKEMLLTSKPVNKNVKREKVTRICTIRKDDTPSLLFHARKTEGTGEIYRVLFFILENNQIKHRFYIDKQISGDLTFKEKQMLGVATVEEWNSQKEVLSNEKFDKEFLDYLENFAACVFPVHSICWQEDSEFLKKYLQQCDFMINHSTIIEQHTSAFFNNHESRAALIQKMGIKKPKLGFFNPIEIDLEIWKNTN